MNFIVKQVLATKKKRIPLFPLISYLLIQTYGKTLFRRIMNPYLKQKRPNLQYEAKTIQTILNIRVLIPVDDSKCIWRYYTSPKLQLNYCGIIKSPSTSKLLDWTSKSFCVGMAMGRGGAEGWDLCPRPAWIFSCPIPAPPRMTGKISYPILAP